jgi:hypothetical protein
MSDTTHQRIDPGGPFLVRIGCHRTPSGGEPAAAMNAGVQAASNVYNLHGLQAQQAWGAALQQATDENGNVNFPPGAASDVANQLVAPSLSSPWQGVLG